MPMLQGHLYGAMLDSELQSLKCMHHTLQMCWVDNCVGCPSFHGKLPCQLAKQVMSTTLAGWTMVETAVAPYHTGRHP